MVFSDVKDCILAKISTTRVYGHGAGVSEVTGPLSFRAAFYYHRTKKKTWQGVSLSMSVCQGPRSNRFGGRHTGRNRCSGANGHGRFREAIVVKGLKLKNRLAD
jgi:hypothetical protein